MNKSIEHQPFNTSNDVVANLTSPTVTPATSQQDRRTHREEQALYAYARTPDTLSSKERERVEQLVASSQTSRAILVGILLLNP